MQSNGNFKRTGSIYVRGPGERKVSWKISLAIRLRRRRALICYRLTETWRSVRPTAPRTIGVGRGSQRGLAPKKFLENIVFCALRGVFPSKIVLFA